MLGNRDTVSHSYARLTGRRAISSMLQLFELRKTKARTIGHDADGLWNRS